MISPQDAKSLYAKSCLDDYIETGQRCLEYVEQRSTLDAITGNYLLLSINGRKLRPIHKDLFGSILATSSPEFDAKLDHTVYSIQRSMEACLDAVGESQSNRKVVGHLFEGLVEATVRYFFPTATLTNGTIAVPHFGTKLSFDRIVKLNGRVVVLATKTSTKDRASMMFSDKFIHDKLFPDSEVRFVSIVLNDVQRTPEGVSKTFLPGHHALYESVYGPMDGHYYIDPPPGTSFPPLSQFFLSDLSKLFGV